MGLQDFNTSRDNAVGDVKSRKNLENLSMDEEVWKALINLTGGNFPVEHVDTFTDEELKCLIKYFDSEIDSEEFFDSDKGTVKDTREDLVDVLKQRKEDSEDEAEEQSAETAEASG